MTTSPTDPDAPDGTYWLDEVPERGTPEWDDVRDMVTAFPMFDLLCEHLGLGEDDIIESLAGLMVNRLACIRLVDEKAIFCLRGTPEWDDAMSGPDRGKLH